MITKLTDKLFIGTIIEVGEEVEGCPEDFPPRECTNSNGGVMDSIGGGESDITNNISEAVS